MADLMVRGTCDASGTLMGRAGRIRIGCSGWQYRDWRGRLYPSSLPQAQWLPYYASVFETVEVNNTFYRLPDTETFAAWRAATPARFLTAVKASRYLTHLKQLRDPEAPLARLFGRILALGPRLGPVLYQLPSRLEYDADRLRRFLDALPRHARDVTAAPGSAPPARGALRHVVEFRHPSWYRDDVFRWVAAANGTVCLHDKAGSPLDEVGIGRFVYVRFHGTSGHYHGSYPRRALEVWSVRLAEAAASGRDVYAYFNNDAGGAAVRNALTLRALIADRAFAASAAPRRRSRAGRPGEAPNSPRSPRVPGAPSPEG